MLDRMNELNAAPPGPPRRARKRCRWLGVIAIVAAASTFAFIAGRWSSQTGGDAIPDAALVTAAETPRLTTGSTGVADIIERAMPSVVSVRTAASDGFGRAVSGQGSGVVLRRDGIILTNAHVVSGASSIEVTFLDGRDPLEATVVGADAEHDIAILQVDANDLSPITIGSSDELALGDSVVALGFPLGLGTTATQGIVSGLDRNITVGDGTFGGNEMRGLLQTDAAINPGNSGGALLDEDGLLVGVNSAAASASAAENIGFAVAIDEALPIIEDILADRDVVVG